MKKPNEGGGNKLGVHRHSAGYKGHSHKNYKGPHRSIDRTTLDRDEFHEEISEFFTADQNKVNTILEEKKPGWEKAFIDQREETMNKVAEAMQEMFKKYPRLLRDSEWEPRKAGSYRDREFRFVILNVDKELGFFTVALIFDPGQSTSPHSHKTLCVGVPYHGVTEETIFDPKTHAVVSRTRRDESHQIEHASPHEEFDLHAVGNPITPSKESPPNRENMAIQIHLYDGHDLKKLLDDGVIHPMITGMPGEKLSGTQSSYEIRGFPSPTTNMRIK
jgi:predicted metal-dependent enzyme (double-stranded beta helix superfamily)